MLFRDKFEIKPTQFLDGHTDPNSFDLINDSDIFYHIEADCTHNVFGEHPLTTISFDGTIEQLLKSFNRIGKYDFAKERQLKETQEIEELPHCSQGWHATITDKINELVEAVNELRRDKNE